MSQRQDIRAAHVLAMASGGLTETELAAVAARSVRVPMLRRQWTPMAIVQRPIREAVDQGLENAQPIRVRAGMVVLDSAKSSGGNRENTI